MWSWNLFHSIYFGFKYKIVNSFKWRLLHFCEIDLNPIIAFHISCRSQKTKLHNFILNSSRCSVYQRDASLKWLTFLCVIIVLLLFFFIPGLKEVLWDSVQHVIFSTNIVDLNLHFSHLIVLWYIASTSSNSLLCIARCSTLIIELLPHHPPALWSVFKRLLSGLLKLFNAFYSNLELDESGTNSLDITAEFQRTPAHSSSANLKKRYLNQSVTVGIWK